MSDDGVRVRARAARRASLKQRACLFLAPRVERASTDQKKQHTSTAQRSAHHMTELCGCRFAIVTRANDSWFGRNGGSDALIGSTVCERGRERGEEAERARV